MSIHTAFNWAAAKSKGIALLIEHAPCCFLSVAASQAGISILNHNPVLELGFAIGGAIVGELIGHRYLCNECNDVTSASRSLMGPLKRYGLALSFGLATWGAHQVIFHDHDHSHHEHVEPSIPGCNTQRRYLPFLLEKNAHSSHGHEHQHEHAPIHINDIICNR